LFSNLDIFARSPADSTVRAFIFSLSSSFFFCRIVTAPELSLANLLRPEMLQYLKFGDDDGPNLI